MRVFRILTQSIFILTLLAACQTKTKVVENAVLQGKDNARLSALGRKAQVSNQKNEMSRINSFIKAERAKSKEIAKKPLNLPAQATDEYVYAEMIRAFQARDLVRLTQLLDELVKRHPFSVHVDNGLVLVGQLHLNMGFHSEALRYFERVISEYPLGNKVAAATFGKAVAYKKLNLHAYALKALDGLEKDFPGSPEALRVGLERRLVDAELKQIKLLK